MRPAALHHHDATGLLAGLDWLPHDGGAGAAIADSLHGGSSLEWRGARAVLRSASPRLDGAGALVARMCLCAEARGHDTSGLRAWVARVHGDEVDPEDRTSSAPTRWWLGGTDDGAPSKTVTEEIHATLADLVRALDQIAMTANLAGIGVCEAAADALLAATKAHGPELPEPIVLSLGPSGRGTQDAMPTGPRFTPVTRMTPTAGAMTAGLVATVLGAAAWSFGLVGTNAGPSASALSLVAPQRAAARSACLQGLRVAWPRAVGWRVSETGCARTAWLRKDLTVPDAQALDLVIWRSYLREGDANAVLAEASAKRLVAGWKTQPTIASGPSTASGHIRPRDDDRRITLWRLTRLPSEPFEPADTWQDMADIARQLAQTFADEPGAVSRSGAILTVEVSEPPARAFDRLVPQGQGATVPGAGLEAENQPETGPDIELLSVTWTGQRTTMRLRARAGELL